MEEVDEVAKRERSEGGGGDMGILSLRESERFSLRLLFFLQTKKQKTRAFSLCRYYYCSPKEKRGRKKVFCERETSEKRREKRENSRTKAPVERRQSTRCQIKKKLPSF